MLGMTAPKLVPVSADLGSIDAAISIYSITAPYIDGQGVRLQCQHQ